MTKTSKFNKLAGTFVFAIVMFAMTAVVYAGAQSEYQTYSRNLAFDIDYLNSLSNEEILTLISCRIDVLNSLNEEFGTDLAFICIYEYGNRAIIIHTLATQSLSEYEYKNRELALSIATARDAVVIFDAVFYSDFTDSQLLEIIYAVEYGYVDIRQMRALIDYGYDVAELFNDYIDNTIFSVPTIQQNIVQHRNG
ncbi:MAG: hypothetical protein FWB74_08015, partial [Defluviitaleaceae bacterium]|nr:hypothetical protein [Defluviitaleaceae bacterium]